MLDTTLPFFYIICMEGIRPSCPVNGCTRKRVVKQLKKFTFKALCSYHTYWQDPEKSRAKGKARYKRLKNSPNYEGYRLRHTLLKYRKYNFTKEKYKEMVELQKSKCAICSIKDNQLQVDHNHTTDTIRGLLCINCNVGLGRFKDNKRLLNNAIKYLKISN